MNTVNNQTAPQLVSVKELTSRSENSWLSVPTLRHYIFHAEARYAADGSIIPGNGLGKAILRVGRKVLIDVQAFDEWVQSHRVEKTS